MNSLLAAVGLSFRRKASCCPEPNDHALPVKAEPATDAGPRQVISMMIEGMDCPACTPRVERALKALRSVEDVKLDYISARATASYDPTRITCDDILTAVHSSTGFRCILKRERTSKRTLRISFQTPVSEEQLRTIIGEEQPMMRDVLGIFQVFVAEGRYPTARALVKALEDAGLDPEVLADEDEDAEDVADVTTALRRAIWRFAWSTLLTVPVLALSWSPKLDAKFVARTGASFGLTTINLVALARPIFVSAFRAVFIGHELDADVLITLSSLSAYLYCVVSYAYNVSVGSIRLETYFETPSLLITLILLGRTVAVFTRSRAALRFAALASSKTETAHAKLYDPRTGTSASIHPALLDPGDHVVIPPGALIVSDGVVILGIADVDESLVTGESLAITKSPGATVIAGTRIVGPAALHVRLTHAVHENRLADIRRIVAEARSSRAPVQDVADALASYIVPLVLVVAVATILIWTIVAALHMHMSGGAAFASALSYAVAVLAISCPCALALCVPLVVIVSGDVAARRGLLIKSSAALQKARRVSHVIFDKTGTLTTGRMRVTQEYVSPSPGAHCPAQLVAALVEGDMHPVSKAVRAYMEAKGQPQVPCTLAERETHPGLGVSARLSGETLRGGSPVWCQQTSHQVVEDMVCAGKSVFCVTIGSVLLAVYALEDDLRPESKAVVAALRTRGIRVSILSGDNQAATMAVGALLGLEPHNVRGGCMPDDKRDAVRIAAWKDVCAQEKKHIPDSAKKASANATSSESIVMFVGDGSNDAGALSQAGVGIALSSGTSLAGSSAEIIILNGSLSTILTMIDMSSQVWRRILLSFSWAACYNFFGVLLASGALVKVRIPPQWAGLGELVSLIPVIAIAFSLKWIELSL